MSPVDPVLAGRVILLTRPVGQGRGLAQRLERLGARVECRPTINLVLPDDPEPARRAIRGLDGFDWLLFTSASGVRFFLCLLHESGGRTAQVGAAIGAIGPATAAELSRAGLVPAVVAQDSRAEGLARAVEGRIRPGARVLVVRPETSRPVLVERLREQGAVACPVIFYRNDAAPDIGGLAQDVCDGRFDVGVFTSPSSFSHLLGARGFSGTQVLAALGRVRLVAIGQVTARAIEEAGLRPAGVATGPDEQKVAEAVIGLYLR